MSFFLLSKRQKQKHGIRPNSYLKSTFSAEKQSNLGRQFPTEACEKCIFRQLASLDFYITGYAWCGPPGRTWPIGPMIRLIWAECGRGDGRRLRVAARTSCEWLAPCDGAGGTPAPRPGDGRRGRTRGALDTRGRFDAERSLGLPNNHSQKIICGNLRNLWIKRSLPPGRRPRAGARTH